MSAAAAPEPALRMPPTDEAAAAPALGFSWLALGYACVVLAAASHAPALRGLRWGPLQALGRVSYAIYLVHLPVLRIAHFAVRGDFPSVTGATAVDVTLLAWS